MSPPKMMPGILEIARRVAACRKFEHRSQEGLATLTGLTRDQLANIETGRTDLTFWVGWKICKALNANQYFLAIGKPPERPFHDFDPEHALNKPISHNASFGAVCATWLSAELCFRNDLLSDKKSETVKPFASTYELAVTRDIKVYLHGTPQADRAAALEELLTRVRANIIGKEYVDSKSKTGTVSGMSSVPTWPQLRKAIAQQTAARGAKAALAEKLGVSRQVLNNWLSSRDQGAPNAELTLKLLALFWQPAK